MAGTTIREPEQAPPERRKSSIAIPLMLLAVVAVLAVIALVFRDDGNHDSATGSGTPVTQTRNVSSFSDVELAGSANVTVSVGHPRSVVIRADDNLVDRVTTTVDGSTLRIGTTGSFTTRTSMSVSIMVPTLDGVRLSGSGRITVDGVDATRFSATLPGSGQLRVVGRADRLDAMLSGSGDMELSELVGRAVTAEVSGSGRLVVQATDSLDAAVSGSGAIVYVGSPATVTKSVTGSGAIVGG